MQNIKLILLLFVLVGLMNCSFSNASNKAIRNPSVPQTSATPTPLNTSAPLKKTTNVFREGDNAEVTIIADFKVCQKDEDCVKVDTDCDFCCGEQAINKEKLSTFQNEFGKACQGYSGGVCDCAPMEPTKAICQSNQCAIAVDN